MLKRNQLNKAIQLLSKNNKTSIKAISEILGDNYSKDQISILKNIINTFLLHYNFPKKNQNFTREYILLNNSQSNIFIGFEILAVLDNKTSPACKALHQIKINKKDQSLIDLLNPPHEINCRCIYSPITNFEKNIKFISGIANYEKLFNFSGNSHLELIEAYLNKYGLSEIKQLNQIIIM